MSGVIDKTKIAHASVALFILAVIALAALNIASTLVSHYTNKFAALRAREESVVILTARLETQRHEIHERLVAIGAAPDDLPALKSSDSVKSLIASACEQLSSAIEASCVFTQTPLTSEISAHQATISAVGAFSLVFTNLNEAVHPPLRIANFTVKPLDAQRVDISTRLEIIGANDAGSQPK